MTVFGEVALNALYAEQIFLQVGLLLTFQGPDSVFCQNPTTASTVQGHL